MRGIPNKIVYLSGSNSEDIGQFGSFTFSKFKFISYLSSNRIETEMKEFAHHKASSRQNDKN